MRRRPGERTDATVRRLLADAHRFAVRKHTNRLTRRPPRTDGRG
ncbi:hypothetical protein [Micromonospora zhanjiangensis]